MPQLAGEIGKKVRLVSYENSEVSKAERLANGIIRLAFNSNPRHRHLSDFFL